MNNKLSLLPGGQPFYYAGGEAIGCILMHGFTGSPGNMRWLGNYLHAAMGATIYAPRLAGHGTCPEDMRGIRWEEWYADTAAAYSMLRECCERVFAIGLSLGAALSLLLASNEAVDGVIAMSTPYNIYDWRVPLLPLISALVPYRAKRETPENVQWRTFVDQEMKRRGDGLFGYAAYDRYPTASLIEVNEVLAAMRDGLPRISAPALLIHSRRDDVVPYAHLQRLSDQMTGTDAQIATIEKSLHVITMDCECDSVFETAAGFIRELTPQPTS